VTTQPRSASRNRPGNELDAPPRPFEPTAETGLLVALPHPDDESFSSGGTMALCADAGVRVDFLCATYGDMGRRMGRPAFADRESLRDVRVGELRAACDILGSGLRYLGLRDRCVEFEDPNEVALRVRRIIEELRPSTVISFYPGYAVHPDHDSFGHIVVLAVRQMPASERPRLLGVAIEVLDGVLEAIGKPHVASDIRGVGQRKIAALKAHRSQTEVMFAQWEKEDAKLAAGESDPTVNEQLRRWRSRMTESEAYYEMDPDARTLLE